MRARAALLVALAVPGWALAQQPAPAPGPASASGKPLPVRRVAVLPFWNEPGTDLGSLGGVIAKSLVDPTSKLGQNARIQAVSEAEIDAAMERDLTAAERDAFAASAKHGDPGAAIPLLSSVARAAQVDLLVVGTVHRLATSLGQPESVEVESWLFVRPPAGPLEDPVRHLFKAGLASGPSALAREVGQDAWWSSSDEIQWFTNLATLHPTEVQKKLLELGAQTTKDRMKLIESIFPEQFLHAKTCKISPEQMRNAALATEQLVERIEPDKPRPHNYRGILYYCGQNTPMALRHFEKAAAIDPTFPDPWYNAGSIYWESYQASHSPDDLEKAFQAFSKAVDDEAGFAEARAKRGLAWLAKGDSNKADADLVAAYHEDGRNPDVLMGRCQLAIAAHQPSQASGFCGDAVLVDPTLADAHLILAELARDEKLLENAIGHYRQAIQARADFAQPRIELIELLFGAKRYREARDEANAMALAIPNHSVSHYWLGKICEEWERNYLCAEQQYAKASELDRGWATLRDDIARVRGKRGPGALPAPPLESNPSPATAPAASAGAGAAPTPPPQAAAPRSPSATPPAHQSYEEFLKQYQATQGK